MSSGEYFSGDRQPYREGSPAELLQGFLHGKFEDALNSDAAAHRRVDPRNGFFTQQQELEFPDSEQLVGTRAILLEPPYPHRESGLMWEAYIPLHQIEKRDSYKVKGAVFIRRRIHDVIEGLELADKGGVITASMPDVLNPESLFSNSRDPMQRAAEVYREISRCNIVAFEYLFTED